MNDTPLGPNGAPHLPAEGVAPMPELPEYDHAYDAVVSPILQRYNEHIARNGNSQRSLYDGLDQLPGYVGVGADKVVFRAEVPGVGPVAVKVMRRDQDMTLKRSHELDDDEVAQVTREHAAPLLKGSGTPKLEQLVTADTERGVLVTTFFEGKTTPKMRGRDFRAISQQDINELRETMTAMHRLGLVPENKESIIFKKGEGFSIVDYMEVDYEANGHRIATVNFNTLEEFITDITINADWEADRNAARMAGAPRDPYYDRPVVRGMARGRLLRMAGRS